MYETIIIGGGLAGLTTSIELARKGHEVLVIEKNAYPFHRVCGEYISNEVKPYLKHLGFDVEAFGASDINKVLITTQHGTTLSSQLDLGAFGMSRYELDYQFYQIAKSFGVQFELNTSVEDVSKINETFYVETNTFKTFEAKFVIGSFGKRSKLDKILKRGFVEHKSPLFGIKYHVKSDFRKDTIAIHNFEGGFCGFSAIENDKFCLCYLSSKDNLKKSKSIEEMQKNILSKNPYLRDIFQNSEFLFESPIAISEVSYEAKSLIEKGILMVGDSAGMIYPITGNGMSIAIRSGILASNLVSKFLKKTISRKTLEKTYIEVWEKAFSQRVNRGRMLQHLIGGDISTEITVNLLNIAKPLFHVLLKSTHGKMIQPTEYS
jgi:flavin-dependent dehydrogenase